MSEAGVLEAQGFREFSGHADQVAAARRFVASAIQGGGARWAAPAVSV